MKQVKHLELGRPGGRLMRKQKSTKKVEKEYQQLIQRMNERREKRVVG